MKTSPATLVTAATVTLALVISTSAQASWYQTFCSNAEGTTRTANGHNQNFTQLTKREWTNRGPVETIIRDEENKLRVEQVGEQKSIVNEQKQSCRKPGMGGVWNSHNVSAGKYKITNDDGSLFDKDIVGVSEDLKSVEVEFICQADMNGLIMCPSK
jgi:hypothetical protein